MPLALFVPTLKIDFGSANRSNASLKLGLSRFVDIAFHLAIGNDNVLPLQNGAPVLARSALHTNCRLTRPIKSDVDADQ